MKRTDNNPYQLWLFAACMFLLAVVGVVSCFNGYIMNEQQQELQDNGQRAEGIERGGYEIRTGRFSVEYGVKYLFTVGGRTYYGDSPVSHSFYRSIQAGTPTEVLYLQNKPSINLDSASRNSHEGVNVMLAGFLSAAAGTSIGIFILVSAKQAKKKAPANRKK